MAEKRIKHADTTELSPFELKLMKKVNQHMDRSRTFLKSYHEEVVEMYRAYHDAREYKSIRKNSKFPSGFMQTQTDQFVSDLRDKLWYTGSPATCVPVRETSADDARLKQEMLEWQDYRDQMFSKTGKLLRDAALYKLCWAKVEYDELLDRRWDVEEKPVPVIGPDGMPVMQLDPETGAPVPAMEVSSDWALRDVPIYKGPVVKRIDPIKVFFDRNKREVHDSAPIAVLEEVTKDYFGKPYFYNVEKLGEPKGVVQDSTDNSYTKRVMLGLNPEVSSADAGYSYVECFMKVDQKELYDHLRVDDRKLATVVDGAEVWAIVGVVDEQVPVRLEESPFPFEGPNLIAGKLVDEEDELIGNSLAEVIAPAHYALTELNGMLLENFKQSIDAFWILRSTGIIKKTEGYKMNVAGGVMETNDDPRSVAYRVEMPRVAGDMYIMDDKLRTNGRERGGQTSIAMGGGDRAAETLGEANMAATQAILRNKDRLKTFEESMVQPLWAMRNHINMAMLDEEYVYGVLGEGAVDWRVIDPQTIRASVDFMCESSQRETNKAVIVQQMLQFTQIAPLAQQMGQPVRIDRMLYDLGEMGFNINPDKLKKYFPLIAMEEDEGVDVDKMLFDGALQGMAAGGQPSPGQELPQPNTEEEAQMSLMKRNQPPNISEVM